MVWEGGGGEREGTKKSVCLIHNAFLAEPVQQVQGAGAVCEVPPSPTSSLCGGKQDVLSLFHVGLCQWHSHCAPLFI